MTDWLDALAYLDLVDPIEGFLVTFQNADWKGANKRAGLAGVASEFLASLAATNCWTIWVERDAGWSGAEIERLLGRHGVRVWGRGFDGERIFFRVKKRQARWAEYLLQRRGVAVSNVFDPRNVTYGQRHAPGSEPPTRRTGRTDPDWIERLLTMLR